MKDRGGPRNDAPRVGDRDGPGLEDSKRMGIGTFGFFRMLLFTGVRFDDGQTRNVVADLSTGNHQGVWYEDNPRRYGSHRALGLRCIGGPFEPHSSSNT